MKGAIEGAEQDGDAPVLLEMSDGLGATAREILVGDDFASTHRSGLQVHPRPNAF
jgi:hypothetical protein